MLRCFQIAPFKSQFGRALNRISAISYVKVQGQSLLIMGRISDTSYVKVQGQSLLIKAISYVKVQVNHC